MNDILNINLDPKFPPPPLSRWAQLVLLMKKPWFLIVAVVFLLVVLLTISLNQVMKALLHSRPEVMVPNLERKTISEALEEVSTLDLSLQQDGSEFDESIPAGTVVRQHPSPEMLVRSGRAIRVVVSKGGRVAFIPSVVGIQLEEAQSKLAKEGLQLGAITEMYSESVPTGATISQEPKPGAVAGRGAFVDLVVSKGPAPSDVDIIPDFIGRNVDDLQDWARKSKTKLKITENPKAVGSPGTVVQQNPKPHQPVVDGAASAVVVPLVSSKQGFRFSYVVPRGEDEVIIRIQARSSKGEFDVYSGKHEGGERIEVPMAIQSTTRVRVYVDGRLDKEEVLEP